MIAKAVLRKLWIAGILLALSVSWKSFSMLLVLLQIVFWINEKYVLFKLWEMETLVKNGNKKKEIFVDGSFYSSCFFKY